MPDPFGIPIRRYARRDPVAGRRCSRRVPRIDGRPATHRRNFILVDHPAWPPPAAADGRTAARGGPHRSRNVCGRNPRCGRRMRRSHPCDCSLAKRPRILFGQRQHGRRGRSQNGVSVLVPSRRASTQALRRVRRRLSRRYVRRDGHRPRSRVFQPVRAAVVRRRARGRLGGRARRCAGPPWIGDSRL